jgi:hypothetical protein
MDDSPARPANDRSPTRSLSAREVDRLVEFRNEGLLTDSELEEQKEKLRWGTGSVTGSETRASED